MKKFYLFIIILLLSLNSLYAEKEEHVFILNSYHPDFRWTMMEVSGIRSAFMYNSYKGTLYVEYLDTKNFSFEENEKIYFDLFKRKYKNFNFKVVVVTDNDAFYFVNKYKKDLFPNSSVVFCGVNGFSEDMIPDRKYYTGVVERNNYEDNISLILKLFPETKEIVSFFDATVSGKFIYSEYKAASEKFKDKVKFKEYLNPRLDSLKIEVSKLKKGQVLLLGELGQDAKGDVYNHQTIALELSKLSNVPVFGMIQDMLRRGIIGGRLLNPFLHGRMAGLMAYKILEGTPADKIKIVNKVNDVYFFDYIQLSKFGVSEDSLPKPNRLVSKPSSVWEANRDLLIRMFIGFGILLFLIVILSFSIYIRRKAEKEVRKSKEYIEKILSSVTDCIWSVDLDKNLIPVNSFFSPVVEQIYGYTLQEFRADPNLWQTLVINEDKDILIDYYNDLINGKISKANFTFRIKIKSGELRWIEQSISITDTPNGGKRFDGIAKNVTEKINQQNVLIKYSKAIEQSPISIVITDTEGSIEYVNPNFEKVTGYSFDEIKGKNPRVLKSGFTSKELYKELWETIKSGNDWKGELYNKRKNGEYFWEIAAISPIKNDRGDITNFVAVKEDITHIKEVEKQLVNAKELAERADRLKDEFLAQMSHEIRTPINAILSFSGLLKEELEDKIEDDLKMAFNIMARAGKRIIRTVDLILNMAELQTGYFKPNFENVNIKNKLDECVEFDFSQLASDKNLELRFNYSTATEELFVDEYTFEVIIKNLIDNAIKYTFKGYIEVNVFDYKENLLAIEVKDTGIGMSDDYVLNLFEPFSQEEQGYTRRFEGNGLGLALIKKYTDLNKAKITVESKKGEGSTFTVFFNKN
ncbi:MAG TPA: ABC transporter substrate binding protein [Melioribacteraceae bacterium]|nr:ABC transporter substrate binding protein [Melioribacteraceae bacterium]